MASERAREGGGRPGAAAGGVGGMGVWTLCKGDSRRALRKGATDRQVCSEGSPCQPAFDSTNCVIFTKNFKLFRKVYRAPPICPPPSPPTEMDGAAELGQTDGNGGAAKQQKMEMEGVSI